VAGAVLFNYAKTGFSESFPSGWLYLQGALFIAMMMWAPRGLTGLIGSARDAVRARRRPPNRRGRPNPQPGPAPVPAVSNLVGKETA